MLLSQSTGKASGTQRVPNSYLPNPPAAPYRLRCSSRNSTSTAVT